MLAEEEAEDDFNDIVGLFFLEIQIEVENIDKETARFYQNTKISIFVHVVTLDNDNSNQCWILHMKLNLDMSSMRKFYFIKHLNRDSSKCMIFK